MENIILTVQETSVLKKARNRKKKKDDKRKKLRRSLMQKTMGRCYYCEKKIEGRMMTIDHFVPKSKGGTDDISNLVPSCKECNEEKDDMDGYIYKMSFKQGYDELPKF